MAKIRKIDMAAAASRAAGRAPSIEDRLRHARDTVQAHPAEEQPAPGGHKALQPVSSPLLGGPAFVAQKPALVPAALPSGARLDNVPLDQIDPNPFNARKIYKPERVKELSASIAAHGQEIPGIATRRAGRYVLAAGHYRLKALQVVGARTMALMVHEGLDDKDLYAYSYRENAEREAQTTLDNALSWRELLTQKVYENETAIAEATGQSLANVNKTMRALSLSGTTLDEVKEDPSAFAMSILYELALYEEKAGAAKGLEMAKLIRAGEVGRKDIQEARANIESPKERKPKETSRQYRIQREGRLIGQLKDWDSGKVTLEVLLDDPRERSGLVEELRARFGLVE